MNHLHDVHLPHPHLPHPHHHVPVDDEELAAIPLFAHLSPEERQQVRGCLTEVGLPAGTVLTRQGDTGHEFFVILSGSASVAHDGVHVADLGPGDFQGEIALLDHSPRTATVTCTTPVTLLVASQREFSALFDRAPTLAKEMLPTLAHRYQMLVTTGAAF
jgi:CRP/FNR family transcriptional regulator, cyclic AMP receptor protein